MARDMLTIYMHYEDANQETKILQRSMMRRDVSYYGEGHVDHIPSSLKKKVYFFHQGWFQSSFEDFNISQQAECCVWYVLFVVLIQELRRVVLS